MYRSTQRAYLQSEPGDWPTDICSAPYSRCVHTRQPLFTLSKVLRLPITLTMMCGPTIRLSYRFSGFHHSADEAKRAVNYQVSPTLRYQSFLPRIQNYPDCMVIQFPCIHLSAFLSEHPKLSEYSTVNRGSEDGEIWARYNTNLRKEGKEG